MQAAAKSAAVSKVVEEISLLNLLTVLAQGKLTILTVTMSCAILAIVYSLFPPARYTATVAILPSQQSSTISFAHFAQLGSMAMPAGSSLGIKDPNDMYVAMLKSHTVEETLFCCYKPVSETT